MKVCVSMTCFKLRILSSRKKKSRTLMLMETPSYHILNSIWYRRLKWQYLKPSNEAHRGFISQWAAHSQRSQLPSWRWTLWRHRTACRSLRTPVSWALSPCTVRNNNKNMTELTAGKISITTEITETTQSIKSESRILTMQKSKTGHNKKKSVILYITILYYCVYLSTSKTSYPLSELFIASYKLIWKKEV